MSMLTVKDAQEKIINSSKRYGEEEVLLKDALGRVLSEKVLADRNYPPFNRATMDGFAIRSVDYNELAIREFEIKENVFAGTTSSAEITTGQCVKIMTGAPVPKNLDAIIKVEDTSQIADRITVGEMELLPNLNIALEAEDLRKGKIVIEENTFLTSCEISSLAVIGQGLVKVHRLPTIAVISTGNEIKNVGDIVKSYQIRDSNSFAIEAFLNKYKLPLSYRRIVKDDKEQLMGALAEALEFDIIITTGGVSMGDADFLPSVFDTLGIAQVFHKVQVKPGKPIWFGKSSKSTVFGLPGNPVSVQVACRIFVEPYLRACFGLPPIARIKLPLLEPKRKKTKFDEFFPCTLSTTDFTGLAINQYNGSGDIAATLSSHGIGLHEATKGDLQGGEIIEFWPWNF
jgi:molybdopterin molybdotransferase